MTSRIDLNAEQQFMVADGGLPGSFGGLLQIVRGIRAITGLGRVALQAKNAAAKVGFSDRQVTHRNLTMKQLAPIGDTLIFLMIGRDAADGRMRLTPLFRCFDIRWSKAASEGLFARMREMAGKLAAGVRARRRSSRSMPGRWASSSPSTRSAAARCPTTRARASSTSTARSTATTGCTCSTARSCRPRSASTRPRRSPRSPSAASSS